MTENEIRDGLKKISEMLESQEWAKHINEIPESHIRVKNKNRDSASGRKEEGMKPLVANNGRQINEQELMQMYGIGRKGLGNIDLYNRPQYMNGDGSVSTVRSMSFNDGNGEILVPTVAFDRAGKPYVMSDDVAITRYYNTGEYLGKFKTIEEANDYAARLHKQQDHIYRK